MSVVGRLSFALLVAVSPVLSSYSTAYAQNSVDTYIDRVLGMGMTAKPSPSYQRPSTGSQYVPAYQHRTFGSYGCTDDCSGHKAGYEWAERNGITDEYDCVSNSVSFDEGCAVYVDDPYRDADYDDGGDYIP